MNFTILTKNLLCISLCLLALSCQEKKTAEVQDEAEVKQKPYNVLFIAIDDLRTELNCYGANHIVSPNIDQLAKDGIRFTNAHVQQAICMASRASILSGIRPEKQGIYTGESVADVLPNVLTMNNFFKQNGYSVASSGKIYHYDQDTQSQFGSDYIEPTVTWKGSGYVTEAAIKTLGTSKKWKNGPAYEWAQVHDTLYKDGLNTLNAMRKLEALKKDGKPFFMAVGLTKPHLPFNAPQKYWDMYPESEMKLSALKTTPKNIGKYSIRAKGELTNYFGMADTFDEIDDATALTLRRGYYACVSYADAQVGNLLAKLKELELEENTIVVVWGDHGYKLGDYNSWCKWSNMNIDTNVPLIFKVPGGASGKVFEQPIELLDLYPTLAELCELKLPDHLEGESIASILTTGIDNLEEKRYAYSIWPQHRWTYDRTIMGYSVTDDRFNYVEWVKLTTGEVLAQELFDHQNDPMEMENVFSDSQFENVVAELSGKLALRKEETEHDHNFKKLR